MILFNPQLFIFILFLLPYFLLRINRGNMNIFSTFEPKKEFKVYISCKYSHSIRSTIPGQSLLTQMGEVRLQYGDSTIKWRFSTFLELTTLYIICFVFIIFKGLNKILSSYYMDLCM